MQHLLARATALVVGALVLASCSESPLASREGVAPVSTPAIVDAARSGQPEFLWLHPSVATSPSFSGTFDTGALDELAVAICQLDATDSCSGPEVERLTKDSRPTPSRLTLDVTREFYQATWLTGPSGAKAGARYRIAVLRHTATLGTLDVQMVQNTPEVATVDTSHYTGVVKGQQFIVRFRLEQPLARNYVRVNEVESNQGTPGDWVELHNANVRAFDLSGYVFRDNDDSRGYVLPPGTTIPGNGFLVLDEAQFGFGLGASDKARLFLPDGTTLVDGQVWTSHATRSYGRCPDGSGAFVSTSLVTRGAANDCLPLIAINEVESFGGVPGDWIELFNPNASAVALDGYVVRDNASGSYTIPAGTTIAANGYLTLDQSQFAFELDASDAVQLYRPGGTLLVDAFQWTSEPHFTYGRCPDGLGAFIPNAAATKGGANNCLAPTAAVKINEVESNGGSPGDWVELYNTSASPVDLSGYVFRDNDPTHSYVLPAGSIIAAGGYLVLDELIGSAGHFDFGLGANEQANLLAPGGSTVVDTYAWTTHAATTYGRCPNGTGNFTTTQTATKGASNDCTAAPTFGVWPGSPTSDVADVGGSFYGGNMSGLVYEGSGSATPGVLWAARNGPGALYRLVWNGSVWVTDASNGWGSGKLLRYPDGSGDVDAEGVTRVGASIYISAERNNAANSVSRNSVLLFDPAVPAATLTAIREWDLTSDLPPNGANLGLEAVTYIPDAYLVANGFRDEARNAPYNPASYPNHNGGLFFVGVEASGTIHAYALNHLDGSFTRVATIASGFASVMDLQFDQELEQLWAICDNTCNGRSTVLTIDKNAASPTQGRFTILKRFERPVGLPDVNNEGFTMTVQGECVGGFKPAFWADDSQTGGYSLRRGTVSCTRF